MRPCRLPLLLLLGFLASLTTACGDDDDAAGDGDSDSDSDSDSDGDGDADPVDPGECSRPAPEWIFCSDFEEGDFSVWDDYDGNPAETNTLVEDGGPFGLAGNHVGRLRVPPGRGGADFVKVLPSTADRVYARWYVQYEPGFDFTAPNHGAGLHAGARDWLGHSDTRPNGDDWFSSWIEYRPGDAPFLQAYTYSRGMYQDCVDPGGSCWGDLFPCTSDEGEAYCERPEHRETAPPPVIADGRWICVEMMMDGGTPTADGIGADGVLDFWVDGEPMGPWNDLWLRTTDELEVSILWLSIFHHEDHSEAGLLFDHAVVSTERIGCTGR